MTTNILLYMKMYFYYIKRCIMTTNILLYKTMYNDNKHFIIQDDV